MNPPYSPSELSSAVSNGLLFLYLAGSKGGETKPRSPVEAPDSAASIAYANILDLVSEGEIEGLVNGNQSIFLDETPIANPAGGMNFSGVTVDMRYGTQSQEYMKGFPDVQSETSVNVQLKASAPWTRAFTNLQLSAVRIRLSVNSLAKQNAQNGDISGYRVEYQILLQVGTGNFNPVLISAFDDKISSVYERSHRIDLPPSSSGWTIRVVRVTQDATTSLISDTTNVVSFTEIVDAKFRYPNSAYIGLKFDASQFQQIPTRAFHLRGIKVKVPSNYNPVTRAYSGTWDGTFKVAYTNCPPWIYYDLLTNDRYGLGHLVKEFQVDRYELYRIAQYCDFMVPDGKGGTEPRFTCNTYLQQRADALRVLQDLTSLFRGMTYWGGGGVYTSADMPEDPTYTYTNANVIDGKFQYSGFRRSEKYSVVLVSWTDMSDFGRVKVEYVEDRDALVKYGHRQTEVAAIGCSSQGQAQRLGRWLLLTNQLESETVTFRVGLDGVLVRPGKVVRVANNKRAGRRIGGRVSSATTLEVVLDSEVELYPGDTITVIMPDGKAISRTVTQVGTPVTWDNTSITWDSGEVTLDLESTSESARKVKVAPAFPAVPVSTSVWAVDSSSLATEQYRILSIKEDFTPETMEFEVTATKHVPGKFDNIDNGTRIDSPPITVIPPSVQAPVASVSLSSDWAMHQGSVLTTMTIKWPAVKNAVAYEVQWKMNNGSWIRAGRAGGSELPVIGILAGNYIARVQAFNANGLGSVWTTSSEVALQSKTSPPPALSFLRTVKLVMGIRIEWGFPVGLDIQNVRRVELWSSVNSNFGLASKQGEYSYPTDNTSIMGLANGAQLYFWGRLIDSLGNTGPWTGPIVGGTETNATIILDYLQGQITQTQLAQSLLDYIDSAADLTEVNSRIDNVITVQNNDRDTFTQQINTAQSTAAGAQAIAQTAQSTVADTNGKLAAMYTIKTQLTSNGKTYIAGIGVGVENNQGIIESQVLVAASRFAVLDPNGSALILPFVIQNGQVLIDQALIGTAWITTAKIADAAITSAKIGNAQITSAKIGDLQVTTGKIANLAVDTLKIAGRAVTLPSSAYTAGFIVSPPNTGSPVYVSAQTLSFVTSGFETLVTCTAQIGMMSEGWCYWRVLLNGSVWLSGRTSAAGKDPSNTPNSSFTTSALLTIGGAATVNLELQFAAAPGSSLSPFRMGCDNRSITALEVMR